ncbi:MAG TPA: leucyl/phenylalanyl-tRNA--protein transferase [Casimicrobiaceae bacterium]|nr:leucyl/phenylalanyl-tRNA--protein transferase [Casimicrobiaceae bacterium]
MVPWLRTSSLFPPIEAALDDPNGLLAAGGDLSAERLIDAYRHGIFPWYNGGQPILWWSPNPRMVLFVEEFVLPRSLRKVVRQQRFEIRVDTAFAQVVAGCAGPRPGQSGTWITPQVIDAYTALHEQGYAHSVESWRDGALVGGLYGVAIGRMFYGESMFARESEASKVALVKLVAMLKHADMPLVDCQQETDHLTRFGGRPISRRSFAGLLARLVHSPAPTRNWAQIAASAPDEP